MKRIHLNLSAEEVEKLNKLKEVYNEKTYTKVLRILIKERFFFYNGKI